ncbi:isochorismatase family protein [Devosia sp.]|uniref:isochorismatase family protein n=1 Tax=Devosia sp. TaxID=1871048 RepID=UPI003A923EE6
MSDTALLVIDAQESFRQRSNWFETDHARYLERQQALIDGAVAAGIPVVRVLHHEPEGVFELFSGHVRSLEELRLTPEAEFLKTRHSALVGTGLDVWLTEHGIRRLLISGIRTEQCCETTTRHASDLGWQVDFVAEATLTTPLDYNGRTLSPAEITERTCAALAGRFATVVTVDEALGRTRAAA